MKIFQHQISVHDEVQKSMQNSIDKFASIENINDSLVLQAIQKLSEAAELYEKSGNVKNAELCTNLVQKISNASMQNNKDINHLKDILAKLNAIKNLDNEYYVKYAEQKIKNSGIDLDNPDKCKPELIKSGIKMAQDLVNTVQKISENEEEKSWEDEE